MSGDTIFVSSDIALSMCDACCWTSCHVPKCIPSGKVVEQKEVTRSQIWGIGRNLHEEDPFVCHKLLSVIDHQSSFFLQTYNKPFILRLIVNPYGIMALPAKLASAQLDSPLLNICISRFHHHRMAVVHTQEVCKKFICLWHLLEVMRTSY
jgi:hypothetical protein